MFNYLSTLVTHVIVRKATIVLFSVAYFISVGATTKFTEKEITSGQYITKKDQVRKYIMNPMSSQIRTLLEAPQGRDRAEYLVDNKPVLNSLFEMESKGLQEAYLAEHPWSDDYWAVYTGILGKRYADRHFPFSSDWKKNFDYSAKHKSTDIFKTRQAAAIDDLSPSEKYDLLISDKESPLTHQMWDEGGAYYEEYGEVESWMGICHGWAPASYNLDRPINKVTVMAADGKTPITFYPADIKALASLLWAKAMPQVKFIGGRCSDKNPETDENGRIQSPDCFDINPMTWHLSVVNQIGVAKRSFVLDATYDYEVWNQPALGYRYTYFNPQTGEYYESLQEALIEFKDYTGDRFQKYRDSSKIKYVVGVEMDVTYMVENVPQQFPADAPKYDYKDTVTYRYDLELDKNYQTIGGEWHDSLHPDFLWTPAPKARALSAGDYYILDTPQWNGQNSVSAEWKKAAQISSLRGLPLARIVESLIELSQSQDSD